MVEETDRTKEMKPRCRHEAKYLKYDIALRTILCEKCLYPTLGLIITEDEAQMDTDVEIGVTSTDILRKQPVELW